MSRRQTIAVLAAVLIGGLCFGPVFGLASLWLPVGSVVLVAFVVTEVCRHWLIGWRLLLLVGGGLLAIIETVLEATTVARLPTLASLRAIGHGLSAWRLTLESTWPARPDPELVIFVPLLTFLACLLAVELLDRAPPLAALLPGLGVVGISQLYIAASGWSAVLVAAALGLVLVALLMPDSPEYRRIAPWVATATVTVVAIGCGFVVGAIAPAGRTPYSLQKVQAATSPGERQASPLDELASRLSPRERDQVVFRYRASQPVDRWRQVALDDFDGVNWTTNHPFLRMGAVVGADVRVPTTNERATVELDGLDGPWLPSQLLPATVSGVTDPQIEPIGGTLLASGRPARYDLTWRKPDVDAAYLLGAGLDGDAPGGLSSLGPVPPDIASIDPLQGKRATFATAIALEKYLRSHYTVAVGPTLPTGYGWPQLKKFLVSGRSGGAQSVAGVPGTSAQFAAAYVVLARLNAIPARLVVGFRAPAAPGPDGYYVVHNSDAFAWPEVAVDGAGWWPLDPAQDAATGKTAVAGSIDDITNQARAAVPPVEKIKDPDVPPPSEPRDTGTDFPVPHVPLVAVFIVSAGLLLLWLAGVPLLKALRALRRRRRGGSASVVGAWAEARDRLRAYGLPVTPGMTVRDLRHAARDLPDTAGGLARVAQALDHALWSGAPTTPDVKQQAWSGVRDLRKALRGRPLMDRFQASVELRTLFTR
ncbi:DUF3488 and transglutaminase-like domain-containing protein [Kribbella sp. NPDC026611]|uniref:transglutaminase TgpA family protein n=1 Tax=Kribbella sp. NPDC026611 TaxID=3154911 RepID=UPI0033E4F516